VNKKERIKARLLMRCKMAIEGDRYYARSMSMLAKRDPQTVLSPKQKWLLDSMIYRYRRQLYRYETIEIPESPPQIEDYQRHPRATTQQQLELF